MGDLKFSATRPSNIKLGTIQVTKIMMGATQVWPSGSPVSLFLVGGGGGGGYNQGGGGGGGENVFVSSFLTSAGSFSVTVGGGGNGGTSTLFAGIGQNGFDSSIFTFTAIGGGGGGSNSGGISGGSGGGGATGNYSGGLALNAATGHDGGHGSGIPSLYFNSGGGGGGGAVGSDGSGQYSGGGGSGVYFLVFASPYAGTYYCGGGGGGTQYATTYKGAGGNGGGGAGGSSTTSPVAGTANLGGGGGGGKLNDNGANGGSGVVLVRYTTADFGTCTGGVKTTNGPYTIHTFNSSGTLTMVNVPLVVPLAPASITAILSGPTSITVQWSSVSSTPSVTSYSVYRAYNVGGPYAFLSTVLAPNISLIDSVSVGNTYYYKVLATNSNGNSPLSVASNGVSILSLFINPLEYISSTEFLISWVNGSTNTILKRSYDNIHFITLYTDTAGDGYFNDTGLSNQMYYYKATDDGGASYSNTVSGNPTSTPV